MIEWHEALASTQDRAHELAALGSPHGAAVAARVQTQGRGTRGRGWESGPGGLWLSVIGRPAGPSSVECLSLRVGLALAPVLDGAVGVPLGTIGLKWPNDLVASDRKLGGILCELRWQGDRLAWLVVGIGINVQNAISPEIGRQSVSLAELGRVLDPEGLAVSVVEAAVAAIDRAGPLSADEIAAFDRRDWLRGRRVTRPIAGVVAGIRPDGHLLIHSEADGIVDVTESPTWSDLAGPLASH